MDPALEVLRRILATSFATAVERKDITPRIATNVIAFLATNGM